MEDHPWLKRPDADESTVSSDPVSFDQAADDDVEDEEVIEEIPL
jgi:hypothetical protein